MSSRHLIGAGTLALSLLGSSAASTQDMVIQHAAIECIVVGKFPKVDACLTPVAQVGKARVYFRPETVSSWFYVDMAAGAACHAGVLPKPTKALVDKKVFYYVDVQGEATARTAEHAPVVVAKEEDCENLAAAPVAATGPPAVYPSVPGGFAGGGLSGAVIAGGVAAVAVVGGAALVAGGDGGPDTTVTTVPVTSPPATTPPPGTTLPGPTPPPTVPPLVVACEAAPRVGEAPLLVQFATFPSGGTGTYQFLWSFDDGEFSPNPNPSHTYLSNGVYNATVRVTSGDQTAICTRPIVVARVPVPVPSPDPSPSPSPTPSVSPTPLTFRLQVNLVGTGTGTVTGPGINCPGDCEEQFAPGTVVTLTATPGSTPPSGFDQWTGHCTGSGPCVVTMVSNRTVVAHFQRVSTLTVRAGVNSDIAGSITSAPAGITCAWAPQAPCTDTAGFLDGTVVTLTVATAGVTIQWGGACSGTAGPVCTFTMSGDMLATVETLRLLHGDAPARTAPLSMSSRLEVDGAEGRVVANGRDSAAVGPGLSVVSALQRSGTNHVEAALVRAAGRAGTWRFDFSGQGTFRPGSLRVIAGTTALVTAEAVVFRLHGNPGERVAFTFEADP